jgi:hypothetical protein
MSKAEVGWGRDGTPPYLTVRGVVPLSSLGSRVWFPRVVPVSSGSGVGSCLHWMARPRIDLRASVMPRSLAMRWVSLTPASLGMPRSSSRLARAISCGVQPLVSRVRSLM